MEVLIAFIVLTVGLLGTVALQSNAKQASYDANQRSAALALANDIVERIRANDSADLVANYTKTFSYLDTPSEKQCLNTRCSSSGIAEYDLYQWQKALRVGDNTGSLANGTVCISPSEDGNGVNLRVIVAWQGRQKLTESTNASINCGNVSNRRTVVLDSYIFRRSA
ncbi:type IV pilus modification protein PilV [Pseudoalteromonas sp. G4]|uniref:type IV pilus modification protein PilV n=1 Tax=Pseudoalteromonas sp. G4 TaxID=2992761 RepID=UPI00237DAB51|nr:type IV pilus modification protein PilV [Pseudoalteromonas sp. G4]MDE3273487.1 type IV pilus modification protein PilV [Pseudoalteromonas sp. G4]